MNWFRPKYTWHFYQAKNLSQKNSSRDYKSIHIFLPLIRFRISKNKFLYNLFSFQTHNQLAYQNMNNKKAVINLPLWNLIISLDEVRVFTIQKISWVRKNNFTLKYNLIKCANKYNYFLDINFWWEWKIVFIVQEWNFSEEHQFLQIMSDVIYGQPLIDFIAQNQDRK